MKAFLRVAAALVVALAAVIVSGPSSTFAANSYSTGFQIQNLSNATANVTIAFYPQGSATASASVSTTIQPNKAATYSSLPSAVAAGFSGGAVISSDQSVASIVNVIANGNFNYGASYTGVTAGAKSVTLPLLFKNYFNFNTFFSVQNTSSTVANVTITYSNGTSQNAQIQPGSSTQFDQSQNANLPAGFNGSAVITSDQDVAAAVVEAGPTTLLSYNGFTDATNTAPVMPLVNSNNFGFQTGISLQNAGTVATNVTVSYAPSAAGTACTETQSIPAKGTKFFALYTISAGATPPAGITSNCARGARFVGSAKVTANSANQPLVGIVNQLNSGTNKGGSYEAFNPAAATSKVVFPIIQDRFFSYFTGFSIVNVGSVATPITCTYSGTPATSATQSVASLAPGATFTTQQLNALVAGFNGSGVCTASATGAKIVGILNQLNAGAATDAFFVSDGINN